MAGHRLVRRARMDEGPCDFEWDEVKRASNLAKHGIDFVDALEIWRGPVLTRRANHPSEQRHQSFGRLQDRIDRHLDAARAKLALDIGKDGKPW